MKKILIILLLLAPATIALTQQNDQDEADAKEFISHRKGPKDCDTQVQRLDSALGYSYNSFTAEYALINVVKYYYDTDGYLSSALSLSLPGRNNISYQTYKRDENGNVIEYLYQEWKNDTWADIRLWEYTFDSNNNLILETHSAKDLSGNWLPYERQFYYYNNSIVTSYIRQSKNQLGEWYDVAQHYYVYNSLGQLVNLYGEYIATKIVFWDRTSFYNESGQLTERFLKVLRYNPVLKKNEIVNSVHNTYFYDLYGDISEVHNDSWINSSWQLTSKAVYYYSIIPGKKVSICHNGHQICVSSVAVKAHIEHGDKLGKCLNSANNWDEKDRKESDGIKDKKDLSVSFSIYPNPAKNFVTVTFTDKKAENKKGYLMTSGGQMVYSFDVKGRDQVTVDISSQLNGTYFIRIVTKDGIESMTVIKN